MLYVVQYCTYMLGNDAPSLERDSLSLAVTDTNRYGTYARYKVLTVTVTVAAYRVST